MLHTRRISAQAAKRPTKVVETWLAPIQSITNPRPTTICTHTVHPMP